MASEWKTCPACKGTKRSKEPLAAHCLGCGGSGQIYRDDPKARDHFVKNYPERNPSDWNYNKSSCLVVVATVLLAAVLAAALGVHFL